MEYYNTDSCPDFVYNEIYKKVKACSKCDLGCEKLDGYDPRVMGQGGGFDGLMFVAEAPGLQETINSQPLTKTGKSGQTYEKLLKALKLKRDDVYTTNIVLCRPPNNRDPEPWEIKKCSIYLKQQMELAHPQLVVTFGRIAAQEFLGRFKITKEHGQIKRSEKFNIDVFPMYHPAYVSAYARSKMPEFKEDARQLYRIIKKKGIV